MQSAAETFSDFWSRLAQVREHDVHTVTQAIELAGLVGQHGVLHLHAHFATAPTTVARLAASLAGIPYSFTAHTSDLMGADVDQDDLAAKIREAAGTVTVNDFSLEYIKQAFGDNGARLERVYNGIRTEAMPFTSPASRPRLAVAVGPLVESSGYDVLIEAIAQLISRGQHMQCHIIGKGPLEAELDALIVKHNLRDVVRIVTAASSHEIESEIRHAAVLVAPSVVASDGSTGGMPAMLLEAMTVGTPCISTDVGGLPEVIVDGQTGIQVPQRDAKALAVALEQILADDVKRVRLALKARVLVESEFNIHRNAERLRSFFASTGDTSPTASQPVSSADDGASFDSNGVASGDGLDSDPNDVVASARSEESGDSARDASKN
jgi:glycosyltransferase involved in cell wall biosynthesis